MSYENIPKNTDETAVLVQDIAPFGIELVQGRVPGKSFLRIFGRNPDIDSEAIFEALWQGGGDYTGFNATAAERLTVFSTNANDSLAGTGARTIRIQGLDASFNPIQEDLNLQGTTQVLTVNSYYRWTITFVLAAGSFGLNTGTIIGRQQISTGNTFFSMAPNSNRALACVTTVPAGKQFLATSVFATIAKKGDMASEVKVMARLPGLPFQVFEWFALSSTGSSYVTRDLNFPFLPVPAGTDMKLVANASLNNSGVAGGIEFIIEDV